MIKQTKAGNDFNQPFSVLNLRRRLPKGQPIVTKGRMNGAGLSHSEVSRRGGLAKSPAKIKACMANLRRAKAAKAEKAKGLGNGKQ